MAVQSTIPPSKLLENFRDMRKKPYKEIVVFSPVGDMGQLEDFVNHASTLGIDKVADFLFIYRQGLGYKDYGLSALHATEKMPLGTSGCFFIGQALGYGLGYETIVVADLDAFLDSRKTFDEMLKIARDTGKAVVPLSKTQKEEKPLPNYFVVNQWGVFPRRVFEKVGFEAPYSYRGGEDWELSNRLKCAKQIQIYRQGCAIHEKTGMGIREKAENPKKYYPYLKGLLVAFAVSTQYDFASYFRFFAWFCYYNTFAIMLGDGALKKTVRMRDFSESDIRPQADFKVGLARMAVAGLSVPITAFEAVSTLLALKAKKMPIPNQQNESKVEGWVIDSRKPR